MCDILEISDINKNDKFVTNQHRVSNRKELLEILQLAIKSWKRDDLYFELIHKKIPVGIINNMQEVFEQENAQKLLLRETVNGVESIRPKTAVFTIED